MINWGIVIPIAIAVFGFVANYFYEISKKRNEKLHQLKAELYYIADKMVRTGTSVEYSTIFFRYYNTIKHEYDVGKEVANKTIDELATYYHRQSETGRISFEMLKSDLKKSVLDLNIYYDNHTEKCDIISLMNKVCQQTPRQFEGEFEKRTKNIPDLTDVFDDQKKNLEIEFYFSGVGFDLIRIQKVIDPKSPTFYLQPDQEKELIKKIRDLKSNERFS